MNGVTRSVAIDIQERGGGFTAHCRDLGLWVHAGTEERALRQLKAKLDLLCPGVRVHLATDSPAYSRFATRNGNRRGVVPIVSTAVSAASPRSSQQ